MKKLQRLYKCAHTYTYESMSTGHTMHSRQNRAKENKDKNKTMNDTKEKHIVNITKKTKFSSC